MGANNVGELWARAILAQCNVERMIEVVAYAEIRAIIALGLCASPLPPAALVREALAATLDGDWPWCPGRAPLAVHLQERVRMMTAIAISERRDHVERHAARDRGCPASGHRGPLAGVACSSSARPLCPAQVGGIEGIEHIAHDAGQRAARVRATDPETRRSALELVELVRARLAGPVGARSGRGSASAR